MFIITTPHAIRRYRQRGPVEARHYTSERISQIFAKKIKSIPSKGDKIVIGNEVFLFNKVYSNGKPCALIRTYLPNTEKTLYTRIKCKIKGWLNEW